MPRLCIASTVVTRRYRNFAPFVRQMGERNRANLCDFTSTSCPEYAGWKSLDDIAKDHVTHTDRRADGSGKKDRVQFERMMIAASQKEFDVLLFWKLDRFTREGTRKTLAYLTRLDAWGISWRSYSEPFFDSCGVMRDVVISIMATLAEQERISIARGRRRGWQGQSALARSWAGRLTRWTWSQ
jgi:DNA invertase Pin-like site-specific DNA recombinase